jgi:hypothetical protein
MLPEKDTLQRPGLALISFSYPALLDLGKHSFAPYFGRHKILLVFALYLTLPGYGC